jgi:hypothetical protein
MNLYYCFIYALYAEIPEWTCCFWKRRTTNLLPRHLLLHRSDNSKPILLPLVLRLLSLSQSLEPIPHYYSPVIIPRTADTNELTERATLSAIS